MTFHPNVLKLGKNGKFDMLFHVMDHSFVIYWFLLCFRFGPRPLLVSKVLCGICRLSYNVETLMKFVLQILNSTTFLDLTPKAFPLPSPLQTTITTSEFPMPNCQKHWYSWENQAKHTLLPESSLTYITYTDLRWKKLYHWIRPGCKIGHKMTLFLYKA